MSQSEIRTGGLLAGTVTRMVGVPALVMALLLAALLLLMQPQRDPAVLLRRVYIPPAPTPGGMTQRDFVLVDRLGEGVLLDVQWSPDGRWLALQKADMVEVYAYDAAGETLGALHLTFPLGGDSASRIMFSPDGARLAAYTNTGFIIWDVEAGTLAQDTWQASDDADSPLPQRAFAFTADSQRVIRRMLVADTLGVYDSTTDRPVILRPNVGLIFDLALSPDGTRLMVVGEQRQAIFHDPTGQWDALPGAVIRLNMDLAALAAPAAPPLPPASPGYVPMPTPAATQVFGGGFSAARLPPPLGWVQTTLGFSPDGTQIALLARSMLNGQTDVVILDAATGAEVRRIAAARPTFQPDYVSGCALMRIAYVQPQVWFSADGGEVMTFNGQLCGWDTESGEGRELTMFSPSGIGSSALGRIAVNPARSVAAMIDYNGLLYLGNLQTDERLKRIGPDTSLFDVYQLAFSLDGQHLLSTSSDLGVRLWAVGAAARQSARAAAIPNPRLLTHDLDPFIAGMPGGYPFISGTFSRDGTRVLLWNSAYQTQTIDLASGQASEVQALAQVIPPAMTMQYFRPFMQTITDINPEHGVAVGFDGHAFMVMNPDGASRRLYHRHVRDYNAVHALSPDGTRLAAAFRRPHPLGQLNLGIVIFDLATGAGYLLPGTQDPITQLTFTSDGTRLVTANHLGTLRFHQVDNGEISLTIPAQPLAENDYFVHFGLSGDSSVVAVRRDTVAFPQARVLQLYATTSGEPVGLLTLPPTALASGHGWQTFTLDHDGSRVAISRQSGYIDIYAARE